MNDILSDRLAFEDRPNVRRFERKRVPLSGKLINAMGIVLADCTILDLSLVGAQISLSTALPIPDRVFLVDLTNHIAYDAHVPWWRPQSAGLAFQHAYKLDDDLPANLEFLKSTLINAKLHEVDMLIAEGNTLPDAVRMAGITGATYARWKCDRADDNDLGERLWQLESEVALLRKLLFELSGHGTTAEGPKPEVLPAARAHTG